MKKLLNIITIVLLVLIPAAAQNKQRFRYRKSFGVEEPIANPIKLPKRLLLDVYKYRAQNNQSIIEFEQTVGATFIDLDGDKLRDLLVQGDTGANITGFWLFRRVGRKQTLVLHTRGLGLFLTNTKHKGLRDVEAASATAVTLSSVVYRFNGTEYRPHRCWSEDLGQDERDRKRTFYRCRG